MADSDDRPADLNDGGADSDLAVFDGSDAPETFEYSTNEVVLHTDRTALPSVR